MAFDLTARIKLIDQLTAPLRNITRSIKGTQDQLNQVTRSTNIYRDAQGRLRDETGKFVRENNRLGSSFGFLNKKISDLTIGHLSFGAAAAGVGFGIKQAVETAIDFEASMSKVAAVSQSTKEEFAALRKTAIDLGRDTSYTAQQISEGMQVLSASGLTANQIIDAIPGAINASVAAGESFASVSEIMIGAMTGFNLQAKDFGHIGDVLAAAANASTAKIMDLGLTMKYAAPIFNTAHQSMETLAAASAILANNSIKADTAGTALRMGMEHLAAPPKKASAALDELGVRATDAHGNFLPLADIIDQLHDKFAKLSDSAKVGAASHIFGVEASPAWVKLIENGGEALRKMTNQMINSNGSAKRMAGHYAR
jgi:TP901 family phage tail tape measure protein